MQPLRPLAWRRPRPGRAGGRAARSGPSATPTLFRLSSLQVATLHHAPLPPTPDPRVTATVGDLATGTGLRAALEAAGRAGGGLRAVVNCAAVSSPAACEADPAGATAINVPTQLIDAMAAGRGGEASPPPLFGQLSTDQGYPSSRRGAPPGRSLWTEDDAPAPCNAYGRSKLAAEAELAARWPRSVSLRCSAMVGPMPRHPVAGTRFLQFVDAAIDGRVEATFWTDEWRSFVSVADVATAVAACVAASTLLPSIINVGGPEPLSRHAFALRVAAARGAEAGRVRGAARGANPPPTPTPADIGMDVGRLRRVLGVEPRAVEAIAGGTKS